MTEEAIGKITHEVYSEDRRFTKDAIDAIVDANTKSDRGARRKAPYLHFDNESFSLGFALLKGRDVRILTLLSRDDPWNKNTIKEAHALVGWSLHAMQDFYSHSTWLDNGAGSIVDISSNWDNPNPLFKRSRGAIGNVCELGVPYQILGNRPTTTGYFQDLPTYPLPPQDEQKCHHGPSYDSTAISDLTNCRPVDVEGIAKDNINCSFRNYLAGRFAGIETRDYVEYIINELETLGKHDGICALMGVVEEDCQVEFKITKLTYYDRIYAVLDHDPEDENENYLVHSGLQEIHWEGNPEPPIYIVRKSVSCGSTAYRSLILTESRPCHTSSTYKTGPYDDGMSPVLWTSFCSRIPGNLEWYTENIWLEDSNGLTSNIVDEIPTACKLVNHPFGEPALVVIEIDD